MVTIFVCSSIKADIGDVYSRCLSMMKKTTMLKGLRSNSSTKSVNHGTFLVRKINKLLKFFFMGPSKPQELMKAGYFFDDEKASVLYKYIKLKK